MPDSEKRPYPARKTHAETREKLRLRLIAEGRHDLAGKLLQCGQPLLMQCCNCGRTHKTESSCRLKWCPSCAPVRAAERAARLRQAFKRMKWPVHLTLTMRNVMDWDREHIKDMLVAFKKFRERKICLRVKGGLYCVEVTNKGAGWHPHLHVLMDCEWLAYYTPPPPRNASKWQLQNHCQRAQAELCSIWGECIGQSDIDPVCWIRRCWDDGVAEEVCKYAVKGSELLACEDDLGPLIDQLCGSRLMQGFGSLHGKLKELDAEIDKGPGLPCECDDPSWLPESVMNACIGSALKESRKKKR